MPSRTAGIHRARSPLPRRHGLLSTSPWELSQVPGLHQPQSEALSAPLPFLRSCSVFQAGGRQSGITGTVDLGPWGALALAPGSPRLQRDSACGCDSCSQVPVWRGAASGGGGALELCCCRSVHVSAHVCTRSAHTGQLHISACVHTQLHVLAHAYTRPRASTYSCQVCTPSVHVYTSSQHSHTPHTRLHASAPLHTPAVLRGPSLCL